MDLRLTVPIFSLVHTAQPIDNLVRVLSDRGDPDPEVAGIDRGIVQAVCQALIDTAAVPMPGVPQPGYLDARMRCRSYSHAVAAHLRCLVDLLLLGGHGDVNDHWSARSLGESIESWFDHFGVALGIAPPRRLRVHHMVAAMYVLAHHGLAQCSPAFAAEDLDLATKAAWKRLVARAGDAPAGEAEAARPRRTIPELAGTRRQWELARELLVADGPDAALAGALLFLSTLHSSLHVRQPDLDSARSIASANLYAHVRNLLEGATGSCAHARAARRVTPALWEFEIFNRSGDPRPTRDVESLARALPPLFLPYRGGGPVSESALRFMLDAASWRAALAVVRLAQLVVDRLFDPLRVVVDRTAPLEGGRAPTTLHNLVRTSHIDGTTPLGDRDALVGVLRQLDPHAQRRLTSAEEMQAILVKLAGTKDAGHDACGLCRTPLSAVAHDPPTRSRGSDVFARLRTPPALRAGPQACAGARPAAS
jgi:hypothetical protein